MKPSTLAVSSFAAALAASIAAPALAQNWRATCDNRQGTTFADVIDSSDPNQAGYNIDPSFKYITLTGQSFPVSQNVGSNTSSANLTLISQFPGGGGNPATHISGFISDNVATASAHRATTNVRAFANDTTNVCLELSGASVATPSRLRVNARIALSGAGASGQVRLQRPSGTDIINMTAAGTVNQVLTFTTNGVYTLSALANTGDIQINSGVSTVTRSAETAIALTCIADYNGSGTVTVQDIFDFLAGYFAGNLAADVNGSGAVSVQDIFDFLAVYFSGCI